MNRGKEQFVIPPNNAISFVFTRLEHTWPETGLRFHIIILNRTLEIWLLIHWGGNQRQNFCISVFFSSHYRIYRASHSFFYSICISSQRESDINSIKIGSIFQALAQRAVGNTFQDSAICFLIVYGRRQSLQNNSLVKHSEKCVSICVSVCVCSFIS